MFRRFWVDVRCSLTGFRWFVPPFQTGIE
jgi:hypothetical protein